MSDLLASVPHERLSKLREITATALRGAWVIGATDLSREEKRGTALAQLSIFSNVLSQQLLGTHDRFITRAHSNVPRSGYAGLPHGWDMHVIDWRARTSEMLTQPVLDYASSVSVVFKYNRQTYADAPLLELLIKPVLAVDEPRAEPNLPVHMKGVYSYEVQVTPESPAAVDRFLDYLGKREATFWIYLEGFLGKDL